MYQFQHCIDGYRHRSGWRNNKEEGTIGQQDAGNVQKVVRLYCRGFNLSGYIISTVFIFGQLTLGNIAERR